jgi:hypothetical protein
MARVGRVRNAPHDISAHLRFGQSSSSCAVWFANLVNGPRWCPNCEDQTYRQHGRQSLGRPRPSPTVPCPPSKSLETHPPSNPPCRTIGSSVGGCNMTSPHWTKRYPKNTSRPPFPSHIFAASPSIATSCGKNFRFPFSRVSWWNNGDFWGDTLAITLTFTQSRGQR